MLKHRIRKWASFFRSHGVIGSASDSKSEGWGFDSLWLQNFYFATRFIFFIRCFGFIHRVKIYVFYSVFLKKNVMYGVLAEWLRRLIRNQLGLYPREFKSHRRRPFALQRHKFFAPWLKIKKGIFGEGILCDRKENKKLSKMKCRHWDLHPG